MSLAQLPDRCAVRRATRSFESVTTTTMDAEPVSSSAEASLPAQSQRYENLYGIVIRGKPNAAIPFEKWYWPFSASDKGCGIAQRGCVLEVEGNVEDFEFSVNTGTSTALWEALSSQNLPVGRFRGVVSIEHRHDQLFETPVEVYTSELPRWRPFISGIGRGNSGE